MASGPLDGMDPRHVAAAEAFLSGESIPEIAATAGVTRQTAWRWFQRADVAALVAEAQEAAAAGALATLRASAQRAARTIVAILDEADPALRLRAAAELLDRVGVAAAEDEADADGESAVLSADGSTLTLGGRRYVAAPSGHEGDPEVTASEGEEDHSETP